MCRCTEGTGDCVLSALGVYKSVWNMHSVSRLKLKRGYLHTIRASMNISHLSLRHFITSSLSYYLLSTSAVYRSTWWVAFWHPMDYWNEFRVFFSYSLFFFYKHLNSIILQLSNKFLFVGFCIYPVNRMHDFFFFVG